MTVGQLMLELVKIENKYLNVFVHIVDAQTIGSKEIDEIKECPRKVVILLERPG